MCMNGTERINSYYMDLNAVGPPRSELTTNTSITCSCYINISFTSEKVMVQLSRERNSEIECSVNKYDEATLDLKSDVVNQSLTLQNDDLSSYNGYYEDISAIKFSITIHSICGSTYLLQLWESEYGSK